MRRLVVGIAAKRGAHAVWERVRVGVVHLAQRVGFGLRNELAIFARPEEADVQLAIQKTVDGVKRGARFVARDVEPAIIQLNDDPVVAVSGEIGKAPANFRRALWFADDDAVLRRGTIRNDRKIGSGRAFEKIRQLRRRERHRRRRVRRDVDAPPRLAMVEKRDALPAKRERQKAQGEGGCRDVDVHVCSLT